MYLFHEDFRIYGDDRQPYGVYVEESSAFYHKHTRITERGYSLSCAGNKYLWKTPPLYNFKKKIRFSYKYPTGDARFTLLFRYDKATRRGFGLSIGFAADETVIFRLCKFEDITCTVIEEKSCPGASYPVDDTSYIADLVLKDNMIIGCVSGALFIFNLPDECNAAGEAGICRNDFLGEIILEDVALESADEIERKIMSAPVTAEIPTYSGGMIPYTLTYSAEVIGGVPYLSFTLDGGVQRRYDYPTLPLSPGQYTVEIDRIKKPYVRFGGVKYYLHNGSLNTSDPRLHWRDVLSEWFDITTLPVQKTVAISESNKIDKISFGYERMEADGYKMQSEGEWEFVFDGSGAVIERRAPEDTDFCKVDSVKNDVYKLIPDDCVRRDEVLRHFDGNHYFSEAEPIKFEFCVYTNKDPRFITLRCQLLDVYGCPLNDRPAELSAERISDCKWKVKSAPLPVACYRVIVDVFFGTAKITERDVAFEVFDIKGEKCAPLESGLPFLFSVPNEQQHLDRDPFDPWNPYESCNMEHYYCCTSFTGHVAEDRRTWELTRPFAREWYVWLSDHRTMVDHDPEKHKDIVKYADYMYFPVDDETAVLRHDYWNINSYRSGLLSVLSGFLDAHPDIRNKIGWSDGEAFTKPHLEKLLVAAKNDWYSWANRHYLECFKRQNEYFKERNPNFKRACYGPFSLYAIPMHTNYFIDGFGFAQGEALAKDIYNGFCQFEDYPCSCAYQTYRGAYSAATILLHNPGLVIYPEQYTSSDGGCIDGLVKFATPPLGAYRMQPWFNTAHAREYVYNTAYYKNGGYHFLNKYGFMHRDLTPADVEYFVRHWKAVVEHKPARPLRSTCFIAECSPSDDRVEDWGKDKIGYQHIFNISDSGLGFVYETSRMSGLPCGFMTDWDSFAGLTEDDCDLIVLPSLAEAPPKAVEHIRRLYNQGVSLFAVSRVDGLEDIFGVKPSFRKSRVNVISDTIGNSEYILPLDAEFNYAPDGAEVMMYAGDEPVVIRNDRAVLLNSAPSYIGRAHYLDIPQLGGFDSISRLLRKVCSGMLRQLSDPIAWTDISNGDTVTGLTLIRDERGRDILLAIDYSDHSQEEVESRVTETVVCFKDSGWKNIRFCEDEGKDQASPLIENGVLRGVHLKLHMHQSCMIELTN